MKTDETLLPQDIGAKLTALTADLRAGRARLIAMEAKYLAARLFIYREQKTSRRLRRKARGIYHDFERIRRQLADDPTLDGQEALDPARDCIQELIDLAWDTMDANNQH